MIILDCGSGETCRNDEKIVKKMIDSLDSVDTRKNHVVIKWQLFEYFPSLIPLDCDVYKYAYDYAKSLRYETTASVFDKRSLDILMRLKVPFVKLANIPKLKSLIGEIPRKVEVIRSISNPEEMDFNYHVYYLKCIRKYPARAEDYEKDDIGKYSGISDHTEDFELYKKYSPGIYETHFKLEDSIGADSGPWAKTPEQLREIL